MATVKRIWKRDAFMDLLRRFQAEASISYLNLLSRLWEFVYKGGKNYLCLELSIHGKKILMEFCDMPGDAFMGSIKEFRSYI